MDVNHPQFDLEFNIDGWLVVWNMTFMTVHSVGNVIIPTDELIFFRGVGQPPTSNGYSRPSTND